MSLERGQIVWVNFNPQKGHEQAGRRPALVISPSVYNAVSSCILVCPITTNITPWRHRKVCSLSNAKEEHLANLADFASLAPFSRVAEVQWSLI